MDMKKCEICGEMYSTTYRTCPFCQEEAAMRKGKPLHRHASDFRNKRGGHAISILLLVIILVVIGAASVFFFGDSIASMLGMHETQAPLVDNSGDSQVGDDGQDGNQGGSPVVTPDTPVVLSAQSLPLKEGATGTLTVSGGGESYTWSSSDPAVATVDDAGVVTAVGAGSATISVTDGFTSADCTVQVGGNSAASGLTINREDFTQKVGQSWQLKIEGTDSPVTWTIEDSSIATIDADGTVTGVSAGTTTAYGTVDGQILECIVRIR